MQYLCFQKLKLLFLKMKPSDYPVTYSSLSLPIHVSKFIYMKMFQTYLPSVDLLHSVKGILMGYAMC
jgi:hypothetical protein